MKPATLLRLALAGTGADALRVTLTALSAGLATLAMVAGLTVLAIRGGVPDYDDSAPHLHYSNALLREPGLRPGVAFTLLLLMIPVLGLAAQCARLGAPERDRRLAALRLAGTTPGQAVLVAAAETGVAALVGALVAIATYFGARPLLNHRDAAGNLRLPTDVLPPAWAIVLTVAGTPVLAAGLAALALRRVTISPFGVIRRERRDAPSAWWATLVLVGVGILPVSGIMSEYLDATIPARLLLLLAFGGSLVGLLGLVLGTGSLTATVGRLVHHAARRPAGLLAGSRLMSDPWSTARSYTTLLLAVAFGGGIAGVSAAFHAERALQARTEVLEAQLMGLPPDTSEVDPFYDRAFQLVYYAVLAGVLVATAALLVSVAESIVTRRRSYATLVASGVPRHVLARAALWQTLGPLAVAVPAAAALGAGLPLAAFGKPLSDEHTRSWCTPPPNLPEVCTDPSAAGPYRHEITVPKIEGALPVPWRELLFLVGGALAIALLVTAVALLVLGRSTRPSELRTT